MNSTVLRVFQILGGISFFVSAIIGTCGDHVYELPVSFSIISLTLFSGKKKFLIPGAVVSLFAALITGVLLDVMGENMGLYAGRFHLLYALFYHIVFLLSTLTLYIKKTKITSFIFAVLPYILLIFVQLSAMPRMPNHFVEEYLTYTLFFAFAYLFAGIYIAYDPKSQNKQQKPKSKQQKQKNKQQHKTVSELTPPVSLTAYEPASPYAPVSVLTPPVTHEPTPVSPSESGKTDEVFSQLERAKMLYDSGVINKKEYATLKRKILK